MTGEMEKITTNIPGFVKSTADRLGLGASALIEARALQFNAIEDRGLTLMLTAEAPHDYSRATTLGVEDYVCDLVIVLRNVIDGKRRRRSIEVQKYRRSAHYKGEYRFTITERGLTIFPMDAAREVEVSAGERFSSGLAGLDAMNSGGWLRDSIVLVRGPTGSGKTTLAGMYARAGVGRGEKVVYYGFEETRSMLLRNFEQIGMSMHPFVADKLHLVCRYPEAMSPEDLLIEMRSDLDKHQPSLIVLDSISSLEHSTSGEGFRVFMVGLAAILRERGRSALLTQTIAACADTAHDQPFLSTIADAILTLDYTSADDDLTRSIRVLKMRGSAHDTRRRALMITAGGLSVTVATPGAPGPGRAGSDPGAATAMTVKQAESNEIRERLGTIADPVGLLAGLFTASPVAFQIYSADGHCLLVNQAFREFFGSEPPPEYNVLRDEIAAATGVLALIHRAFAGETVTTPPVWYDPRELTQVKVTEGRRVAIVGSFFPVRDGAGTISHVAIVYKDVTIEMQARELAEAGRCRAEAAERRGALLSRVSALLSAPLDSGREPGDLARLLVPDFADICSVFLVDETGTPHRVAEAATTPEIEADMRRMRSLPMPHSLARSMMTALREGQLHRFSDYEDRVVSHLEGDDAEYVALIRAMAPRDAMIVPLRARGRIIGVLTMAMVGGSGRRFDPDDEGLAREIGERAGLGIDNARLFAEATAERVALQVSEERRRLAVEAAGTGTWDFDVERDTLTWDARSRELFGVAPGEPVDYSTFLARLDPEDRVRVDATMRDPVQGRHIDIEYRARTADGERWIRSKGQAHLDADGRALRLLGTVQDISDRKRTERELEVARQRAEEANTAKDEFLALLGHELRNPLAPILTALQLMRMRNSEVMARERSVIERQVNHMVRLVDDLLDVSRITRRKVALKRATIELATVVDRAIEIAGPLLEQRAHRLTLAVPRAGLMVDGDEHRLAQVVANLLTNAARYTAAGGDISIAGTSEGGQALLRVRDSGAGIDAELLPRVFDLFVQGRRAIDRADGGLGLGLTIVRSLVELHGGTVTASSQGPGQGSEFVVHLPLAPAGAVVAVGEVAAAAAARSGGCRVLIVDDNRDAAELLAEVLEEAGHVTRIAFDGPGALRVAVEFRPRLALLDIGLPVMDGYELARRMRELPGLEEVALVALTGYGQPADRERSRVAGFDLHLTKPVEVPELEAVVARFAAGRPGV